MSFRMQVRSISPWVRCSEVSLFPFGRLALNQARLEEVYPDSEVRKHWRGLRDLESSHATQLSTGDACEAATSPQCFHMLPNVFIRLLPRVAPGGSRELGPVRRQLNSIRRIR